MSDSHENTDTEKPRPKTLRDGDIKASIWRNEGEKGVYYVTTLARTYEGKDGELRDTNNFVGTDLLRVAELAREAYTQSRVMDREERKAAFKEKRKSQLTFPRKRGLKR